VKRIQAFSRLELVLTVGFASATSALLLPQLSEKRVTQDGVAMQQESRRPYMMIDDFRVGDSLESVEQRLAGLGRVRETREKALTCVRVLPQTPDAYFRAVFKAGKLESAWQTAPLPGTKRRGKVLLRVLNADSEDETQNLSACAPQ